MEDDEYINDENDPQKVELITDQNDPEKVEVIKNDRRIHTTSIGDELIGSGSDIIKPKNKKEGSRSWFNL